ncbi:MAG: hypothetical protein JNM26_18320 [Ideonella sp.]|nr:hypothetical protein [Ideonella sp.]
MDIARLLFIALIVVIGFFLVNRMYYSNQKYDLEYRRKRMAKLQEEQQQKQDT